jgi:hypothetical protein
MAVFEARYFDSSADIKRLPHLWSLANHRYLPGVGNQPMRASLSVDDISRSGWQVEDPAAMR